MMKFVEDYLYYLSFPEDGGYETPCIFVCQEITVIRENCSILCSDFTLDVRVIKECLIVTNFVCEGLNNVGCQNCLRLEMFV